MAVNLSPIWGAGAQLFDNSGNVLTGGKIYTYAAGTTTPAVTYTASNGVTANSNPIILNSAGRVPYEIWLTDGISYKYVLKDSNDTLIATYDNLTGINSNFLNYAVQEEIQTATAGQTVFTLGTVEYQPGTNTLSVFVDGVNQYDGVSYSYVETDSTTVTFNAGLHVGALVKFTTATTLSAGVTDASLVVYDPPFIGSVATTVEDKLAQYVSVKDFGAVGDGVTDDTAAINNAIIAVNANGGGTVFVPSGTYIVSSTGLGEAVILKSNVALRGAGKNASIIKLADASNDMVIAVTDESNVAIRDLTVDGNRVNQTIPGTHGIRSGGVDNLLIDNVTVQETNGYGIGLEAGVQNRIRVNNVDIYNTRDDGFDIKNHDLTNDNLMFSNITVVNPGLGTDTGQTGMDIRGPATLVNIFVKGVKENNVGLRFRNDGFSGSPYTGYGGRYASITNFKIESNSATNTVGLDVVAYDVKVSNGFIKGAMYGIHTQNLNNKFVNIVTSDCTDAYVITSAIDDAGATLNAYNNGFYNCHANCTTLTAGTRAFKVEEDQTNIVINGCTATNINEFAYLATGTQVTFTNCDVTGCANYFNDNGTLNRYRNNTGYVNEETLISEDLDIHSIGTKPFLIAHNLDITPSLQDVSVSLLNNTGVYDYALGYVIVDAVHAHSVEGRIRVTTASATVGAVVNVGLKLSVKAY